MTDSRMVPLKQRFEKTELMLRARQDVFAEALEHHGISPASFVRVAMTQAQLNPKLLECDQRSFALSLMNAAHLGLMPDGARGLAYLIPFRGKVTLIPGYVGLRELCWRTGKISFWASEIVYESDDFEYDLLAGTAKHRKHEGAIEDRGEIRCYYSAARVQGSPYLQIKVMTKAECEQHRDRFAMGRKGGAIVGPWVTDFDAMALKTTARALVRQLPQTCVGQAGDAIAVEDHPKLVLGPPERARAFDAYAENEEQTVQVSSGRVGGMPGAEPPDGEEDV